MKRGKNKSDRKVPHDDVVPDVVEDNAPVFERSITFDIPASRGPSGLQIKATENGAGEIVFELIVLPGAKPKADLQALFFNTTTQHDLSSLTASGEKVRGTSFGDTKDVGFGQNVHGQSETFDFGVGLSPRGKAGLATQETSFTLGSTDGPLTLDDIGGMEFGARINGIGTKPVMTVTAPHAPDAVDDTYDIFEDGVADVTVPSQSPAGIVFSLLENDTDGDGNTLTISAVRGAQHGTVEIIDGDDADDLVGDAVLYTAFTDYSGTDSFEYLISDGAGGTDFAKVDVDITAVADIPTLMLKVLATSSPDQMILRVVSEQTDLDVSEYIDRFELTATDAFGSVFDLSNYIAEPVFISEGQETTLTHDFLITLPTSSSTLFDLQVTAFSKELSNGDEESASESIRIETVARSNNFSKTFDAQSRSIWGNNGEDGGDVGFNLGFGINVPDQEVAANFYMDATDTGFGFRTDTKFSVSAKDITLNAGLSVSFSARGGQVDANVVYDGNVSTLYNKTVDQLQFTTSAEANIGKSSFNATTPTLGFDLGLTALNLSATMGVDVYGYVTFDGANTSLGTLNYTMADIDLPIGLNATPFLGSDGLSIVRLENGRLKFVEIPGAEDVFLFSTSSKTGIVVTEGLENEVAGYSVSIPYFGISNSGTGNETTNVISGSNNGELANITLDLDGIASQLLGITNPVSIPIVSVSKGPFTARATLSAFDYDLVNSLNYVQKHTLDADGLEGKIIFEDGSYDTFIFGDTLVVDNASSKDKNGDGVVDYDVLMDPVAKFNTQAGFNIGMRDELDVIKAELFITAFGDRSLSAVDNFEPNAINNSYSQTLASETFTIDFGVSEYLELIA